MQYEQVRNQEKLSKAGVKENDLEMIGREKGRKHEAKAAF